MVSVITKKTFLRGKTLEEAIGIRAGVLKIVVTSVHMSVLMDRRSRRLG